MSHSHSAGSGCCAADLQEGESLFKSIDLDGVRGLNADTPARRAFRPWESRGDRSTPLDSGEFDGEMIVHVPFTSTVVLKRLCVSSEAGAGTPARVRVFKDRPSLSFEEAADSRADDEAALGEGGDPGAEVWHVVKAAKFGNVSSVQLHFVPREEETRTRIFYIGLRGQVTGHRHGAVVAVYEAQAQLADHKAAETTKGAYQLG